MTWRKVWAPPAGELDEDDVASTLSALALEVECIGYNARFLTEDELRDSVGSLARWATEILADLDDDELDDDQDDEGAGD